MGSKKKNKTSAGDSAGAGEDAKGKEVISDPRFSKVHSDPRFQKFSKRKTKIAIDDRFSSLFTDKRFAGSSAPVDKRGKPRKHSENALRRYYRELEDGDEEENEHKKKQIEKEEEEGNEGTGAESPDSESSESETESESDSESESDGDLESDASTSTTDTDDEADDAVILGDDDASVEVENVPVIERETHRLAVVNMDWSQVKATDLFVMLSSFLPKGGQIKTVTVYPSEFGLQRMQEEAVRGPAALFDDEEKKDGDDEDEDEEEEIDTEKLREYEKSRLRYYYAVVECDSVATADYLYKACDGIEFERSSNVLDLRFIPDSMEFKRPPRDVATEAPTDYDGLDFHTRALQHSNVVLSWDDDEPHRKKTLRRKFNEKQLAELELKEFLASDESESENGDEDEGDNEDISGKKEKKLEMYRALVQSGDGSEEENDDGQEMEVTFNTGLEDLSTKILEKKDKGSETVWEAYLRKRKEKKKARKSRSKNSSDDESDESDDERPEQPDDFFEEDPSVGKTKKSGNARKSREEKGSVEDKAAEASRAELELLLADEKGAEKKVKGHRIKHKKGKKGEEAIDEDSIPTIDEDDPRFAALFTNPVFALDPTDPQFKRSATYLRQLAQKQNKAREKRADKGPMEQSKESSSDLVEQKEKQSSDTPRKEKNELSSIVKSLKMKSQQFSKPPGGTSKKEKMGLKGSAMKEKKHKLPSLDRPKQKKTKV